MFSRTWATALSALSLSVISFSGSAAAVNCAVCPPSIFYSGQTRTLTLTRKSTGMVQCNYDSPSIPGFSPYCVYQNVNGALVYTNTGGACPNPTTVVVKSTC